MKGFHTQINARSEADLDEQAIIARLTKASGASYDSGQKVQGNSKNVPSSVAQGREQATQSNVKAKTPIVNKQDYNKKDESAEVSIIRSRDVKVKPLQHFGVSSA